MAVMEIFIFFFQAEDGIRDAQESRGLGDVYKRQFSICYHIEENEWNGHISLQLNIKDIKPMTPDWDRAEA